MVLTICLFSGKRYPGTWSRIEWELNSFPIPRHEHNVLCFWNAYWWKVSSVQLINIVFSAVWFAAYKPPRQWRYWVSLILHLNMDPKNQMMNFELFYPHNFFYTWNHCLKKGWGDLGFTQCWFQLTMTQYVRAHMLTINGNFAVLCK